MTRIRNMRHDCVAGTERMNPALLVIDIQNAWLDSSEGLRRSVEARLDAINRTIGWFRRKGLPIIVISHESVDEGVMPGKRAFEFTEAVNIADEDTRLTKRHPSSFCRTDLEAILREKGRDTVVIVGLSATGCALATFFGALERDFNAYMVEGAVAASSEEHVRFVEEICDTLSPEAFDRAFS